MEKLNKKIKKINHLGDICSILTILICAYAIFCIALIVEIFVNIEHNTNYKTAFFISVLAFGSIVLLVEVVISYFRDKKISKLKNEYKELLKKDFDPYMMKIEFLEGPSDENGVNIIIINYLKEGVTTSYISFKDYDRLFKVK